MKCSMPTFLWIFLNFGVLTCAYYGIQKSSYQTYSAKIAETRAKFLQLNSEGVIVSANNRPRLLQTVDSGFLVRSYYSSPGCIENDLYYSDIYKLGACQPNGQQSYSFTDYEESSTGGISITLNSYSDPSCQTISLSSPKLYEGCQDSYQYSFAQTVSNLPSGVMSARYQNASKCDPKCDGVQSNFYFAQVIPIGTCYGGYQYTGCDIDSFTYCKNDLCPLPVPTTKPFALPTVIPSPNPTPYPSSLPTTAPTETNCPCGTYLSPSKTSCNQCPAGTYSPGTGADNESTCAKCTAGWTSVAGACVCEAPPTPLPTTAPVANPTTAPIAAPTKTPTGTPLATPTQIPSEIPTIAPTKIPSASPSLAPHAPCPCGTYLFSGACTTCPPGTFSAGTTTTQKRLQTSLLITYLRYFSV